jgi:hypothetical protein
MIGSRMGSPIFVDNGNSPICHRDKKTSEFDEQSLKGLRSAVRVNITSLPGSNHSGPFVRRGSSQGNNNMTEKLVTIGRYSTPFEANMAKSQLESAGIPAFVADEYTIGMNWLYSNALGGVKVQVPESLASEAQELLASEFESPAANDLVEATCPRCGGKNIEYFLDRRAGFLTWVFLGIPLLFPSEKKKCVDCGYHWKKLKGT